MDVRAFQVQGSKLRCSFFADWKTGRWCLFSTRRNNKMSVSYHALYAQNNPEPDDKLSESCWEAGRRVKVHYAGCRGEHDERITPNWRQAPLGILDDWNPTNWIRRLCWILFDTLLRFGARARWKLLNTVIGVHITSLAAGALIWTYHRAAEVSSHAAGVDSRVCRHSARGVGTWYVEYQLSTLMHVLHTLLSC